MAILVLFVFVLLGTLIVSISMSSSKRKQEKLDGLTERVAIESIGEGYLQSIKTSTDFDVWKTSLEEGYTATESAWADTDGEGLTFNLYNEEGEQVLFIKLQKTQTGYTVLEWK